METQFQRDPLPFGAAGAVGVIALMGGIGLSRRRRRRIAEETAAWDWDWSEARAEEEEPVSTDTAAEPELMLTEPAVSPAANAGNNLPEGFDLSRFGPHVQAAYRGPTPDNPSLSLRHRLRRAAAMDQRERQRASERIPLEGAPQPQATSGPAAALPSARGPNGFAVQGGGQFMLQRASAKPALTGADAE
jgi:hypothetical protein